MANLTYDTIIRGGVVVAASGTGAMDVGIRDGEIVELADKLSGAATEIDATGQLVLPGGVDTHCHIEQISGAGLLNADTFETATRSAAFGGTTTTVSFAAQHPGNRMLDVVRGYSTLAAKGALIDHAFHMIVADTSGENLANDIPRLIADGHRSIKIFTTYDKVRQDDHAILDILTAAKREGALVCFHAENDGIIRHMTAKLLTQGKTAAKYHAESHPREAEIEAIDRMCRFAEFIGTRIMIFHVSTREGVEVVRKARARGVLVEAETCPHYLFQTVRILESERPERFMCSPPQRSVDDQNALWEALADGTLQLVSSDHAPYRMDGSGKFANGEDAPFNRIANGMPGLETRLPLMFDAIVSKKRGDLRQFVNLTSTAPAKAFGLSQKGGIAKGLDADIAIWAPDASMTYADNDLHDNVGYNPCVGRAVKGLPVTVLSRGETIIKNGAITAKPGRGRRIKMAQQ